MAVYYRKISKKSSFLPVQMRSVNGPVPFASSRLRTLSWAWWRPGGTATATAAGRNGLRRWSWPSRPWRLWTAWGPGPGLWCCVETWSMPCQVGTTVSPVMLGPSADLRWRACSVLLGFKCGWKSHICMESLNAGICLSSWEESVHGTSRFQEKKQTAESLQLIADFVSFFLSFLSPDRCQSSAFRTCLRNWIIT